MKISGIGVAVPLVVGPTVVKAAGEDVTVYGPGKVPVTLNGEWQEVDCAVGAARDAAGRPARRLQPDRREAGVRSRRLRRLHRADGRQPVYACSVLAIDAQGKKITTIEGLAEGDTLTPVMQAFVDHDAQQCGFCTPGFVVATTHFLQQHPSPLPMTYAED